MSNDCTKHFLNAWQKISSQHSERDTDHDNTTIRCSLGDSFGSIYFTRRESQCMLLLLRGKTMKEAARTIGISLRTVESYISNMKKKLGCNTKSQLIEIVLQSNFLKSGHIEHLLNDI